jgi:hypothetical protein
MPFEITGKVVEVLPLIQVSEKFRKREFVIERKETGSGAVFIDYIKFQLVQDKCEMINESYLHDEVKVYFNIRGNRWERDGKVNYFTNLDAWKIERTTSVMPEQQNSRQFPPEEIPPENEEFGDLPF